MDNYYWGTKTLKVHQKLSYLTILTIVKDQHMVGALTLSPIRNWTYDITHFTRMGGYSARVVSISYLDPFGALTLSPIRSWTCDVTHFPRMGECSARVVSISYLDPFGALTLSPIRNWIYDVTHFSRMGGQNARVVS